jgi:hypothetical protein
MRRRDGSRLDAENAQQQGEGQTDRADPPEPVSASAHLSSKTRACFANEISALVQAAERPADGRS